MYHCRLFGVFFCPAVSRRSPANNYTQISDYCFMYHKSFSWSVSLSGKNGSKFRISEINRF